MCFKQLIVKQLEIDQMDQNLPGCVQRNGIKKLLKKYPDWEKLPKNKNLYKWI